ncbi:HAMP domain-containing protein [Paenibacillus alba]|uniref:HAMP domain-containing protein n=1 Tax=Paenibacillus alba TaxID=1197127 RepID=UPI001566F9DF|nr:HAMP domain-containing protein [Paenibacillus alba]NQX67594.1 HAMP domain-containing protein [Paenibacillus alba]
MTLYLRVVLTFLAVVVVSVLLAFFIAMLLYTNRITTELQASLLKVGNQLAEMSNEYQTTKLETLLEGSTKFNDSYSLFLFDDSGYLASFGVEKKNDMIEMDQRKVISVLQGNIYQNEKTNFIYADFKQSTSLMIGIPLAVNGRQYALFLTPKVSEVARKQTRNSITTVLLIVLLIGSLLILVASRYIVSPMKKLTRATNRLARGNFNVNVNIQRSDEIGLLAEGFNHMAGELKQLEQMRQDFVSNVSHEIQSPLTSIRGFSKVLRQSALRRRNAIVTWKSLSGKASA